MADLSDNPGPAQVRAEEVARTSYGRLLALLAAPTGDIAAAEDALAHAFEQALNVWPQDGIPDNPEAWLLVVSRNRERDRYRSAAFRSTVPLDMVGRDPAEQGPVQLTERLIAGDDPAHFDPDAIGDHRLELLFVCAYPAIAEPIRTPLMLQTMLGYQADQIAAVFAMPTSAMAQRLVRAKRKIRAARIPFAVPDRAAMPSRLTEVLEAIYGAYSIDWHGTAGGKERPRAGVQALQLADVLATLLPDEPEARSLAALIAFSLARAPARLDPHGAFVPLDQQDTSRWDHRLIAHAEWHLGHAQSREGIGRFQLEAAIQSVHTARHRTGNTDWEALATLYRALLKLQPTLGSQVSLAAVVARVDGPAAGLSLLDRLDDPAALRYQPAWATRAHLLAETGKAAASRAAYDKAIALTTDPPSAAYLRRQRARLDDQIP